MATEEWVEVVGPSVETAVQAALDELGLTSTDQADIEIIQEPQRGFLGMGGQDAIVKVKKRESSSGSRSRRSRGKGGSDAKKAVEAKPRGDGRRPAAAAAPKSTSGGESQTRNSSGRSPRPTANPERPRREREPRPRRDDDDREDIPVEDQAAEIVRFLTGLLDAFGLEGTVQQRIEEGVIYVEVVGQQTEALVGPKGAIIQAVLELCRTIVQRKTMAGAKIRLDIAGYSERRREALRIYTARLAEKVLAEGGEIMLEPMNAADRKVVHDAVAEIDGISSFSEGEEPRRSVVIAKDE